MNDQDLTRRAEFLRAVATEAGALAQRYFADPERRRISYKGLQDDITEADGAVERLIRSRIEAMFPGDNILGEETGGTYAEPIWVIDPIDGTANFGRGVPHYCVSIAFVADGKVQLGALSAPATNDFYFARRGHGAFLNGERMAVNAIKDLKHSMIECGWNMRRPFAMYRQLIEGVVNAGAAFKRTGSGALGIAYVACGRNEGYVEMHINSWDALAALLLVEEAGGYVNDFLANDGLRVGNVVIACAPGIKPALLALVAKVK